MVGLKQEFRQSQQLVMTQQLQQSIKLLQLSAVELQEFIDAELEKNPLLQREENDGVPAEEAAPVESKEPSGESEDTGDNFGDTQDAFAVAESSTYSQETSDDREWDEPAFGEASYTASVHEGASRNFDSDEEGRSLEDTLSSERNLRDHLLEQIAVDITDPVRQLLAVSLVDMLDDAGYLREDMQALEENLGAGEELISHTIKQLQRLDPPGIFARNLSECLAIQLTEMNRMDPVMEVMLEHLELLGKGDIQGLRKKCGVDQEDFDQMLADIRRCNPKPASGFIRDESPPVIPDVLVRRGKAGAWMVELNSEALPRVLVNRHYATEVGGKGDKEAKKYLADQLANANWLIKALDQRANTILKVAEEIVKQQDMFLMHGIRFLKPLVLKDISEAVGMHESTISRVTTNKFMATPRGTLEMKYFFTSSISGSVGDNDFSSKTVQYYIKELIDNETVDDVLSDDAIVTRLKGRNIDVARRTVTKYREAMHIPSSVVRRRMKLGKPLE